MNINPKSSSLVIIADVHNPTLLFGDFFINSGIIKNDNEIIKENLILTPAFGQVKFKDNDLLIIDPNRLMIQGNLYTVSPFLKGQSYCDALKFIKCVAIGINFDFEIENLDIIKQFNVYSINNYFFESIKYKKIINERDCNIEIINLKFEKINIKFNFDYKFPKDISLSQIGINLKNEAIANYNKINNIINDILNRS